MIIDSISPDHKGVMVCLISGSACPFNGGMKWNGSPILIFFFVKKKKRDNKILQYFLLNNFKEINKLVDIK